MRLRRARRPEHGPVGSGVAIFEIDGRLIFRVTDGHGGLGVERMSSAAVIDGYPDVAPDELGSVVLSCMALAVELSASELGGVDRGVASTDHRTTLRDAGPKRYRLWRQWQRAARFVSVSVGFDGALHGFRWHPGHAGGWGPIDEDDAGAEGYRQQFELPMDTEPATIGSNVLELLMQPPLANG